MQLALLTLPRKLHDWGRDSGGGVLLKLHFTFFFNILNVLRHNARGTLL